MDDRLNGNSPLVSVVIPVYNGEKFIADSISSVLNQTYQPVEIIVVDDGSEDGTAEIIRSFEDVKYIYQVNQGHGQAKNAGIEASSGYYLAFNDADDIWEPNKLNLQIKIFKKNPQIGYVICNVRNFLEPGTPMPEFMNKSEFEEGFTGYITGAVVISRSALEKVGCFNPGLRIANDSDWFFRAKDAGMHLGIVDEVLVQRRIHDANQTLHREPESKAVKELFELVRESVHRKQ